MKDVQKRWAAMTLLAIGGSARDPFRLGSLFPAKAVKAKSLSVSILVVAVYELAIPIVRPSQEDICPQ